MTHRAQVAGGLFLSVVALVATGIIALVAPFETSPWTSWAALGIMSLVATYVVVGIACSATSEGGFWTASTILGGVYFALGALIVGLFATDYDTYESLLWAGYVAGLVSFVLSTFTMYLTNPVNNVDGQE